MRLFLELSRFGFLHQQGGLHFSYRKMGDKLNLSFLLTALIAFVSSSFYSSLSSADLCLANPDWGIIITDHGYSDVLMDLRIVDGNNYRGREYLSGEYATCRGICKKWCARRTHMA